MIITFKSIPRHLLLLILIISCGKLTNKEEDSAKKLTLETELLNSVSNTSNNYNKRLIENLVFKGGGVLGIAYAGAIKALDEEGMLQNIKRTAGTSAGSIVAALVAFNYSSDEILELISETNFINFEKDENPIRIATKYGLYDGLSALVWIESFISKKTNNPKITFAEMEAQGYKQLRVFATDLTDSKIQEFSSRTTPNTIVSESIRASMSIPLFFDVWKFSNSNPNDHFYVDGGLTYNYPISTFSSENTLGFYLYHEANETEKKLSEDDLPMYIVKLFKTAVKAQELDFMKNKKERDVSVLINDFGISPIKFDLYDKDKKKLFISGFESTKSYLETINK